MPELLEFPVVVKEREGWKVEELKKSKVKIMENVVQVLNLRERDREIVPDKGDDEWDEERELGKRSCGWPSRRRKQENGIDNRVLRPLGSAILSDYASSPFSLSLSLALDLRSFEDFVRRVGCFNFQAQYSQEKREAKPLHPSENGSCTNFWPTVYEDLFIFKI